jgi:DNA-binding winged helix-turn-helix (wHTH) protein
MNRFLTKRNKSIVILAGSFLICPLLAIIFDMKGDELNLTSVSLLFFFVTALSALRYSVGRVTLLAIENFLLLNYFFVKPRHSFSIKGGNDLLTLLLFLFGTIAYAAIANKLRETERHLRAIPKPRSLPENNRNTIYTIGKWDVNIDAKHVEFSENPALELKLTPAEWQVLIHLADRVGDIVSAKGLLIDIWGDSYANENKYLQVLITQLRKKLEINAAKPKHILSVPGGYKLVIKK